MSAVRPFRLDVPDATLDDIRRRVSAFPWQAMPRESGWTLGTDVTTMRELCDYWLDGFDWRAQETRINELTHHIVEIDGTDLHFIHEKGSGPAPMPLLLSHGWPGSIVEFLEIVEPLAHPERFGGRVEDAFDVVAPSLPGFGFSAPPSAPMGPRGMARRFDTLMVDVLGLDGYLAQGGDWGGAISSWLGFEHAPRCRAIHLNIFTMRHPDGPQTPDESRWAADFDRDQVMEDGYRTQQATRPQTLAYAMADSPVGVAAWILEKFHAWSDLRERTLFEVHDRDTLLTNIMLYLVTDTFGTASWIYYGRREEGGRVLSPDGRRVEVPTALALFPEEMLAWPPRSYADRVYDVVRWSEMPRGGHFAALEEPALLIEDVRAFARGLRG